MNEDVLEEKCPNNTIVEMASVNKLKDSLLRTRLVVPAIPDTDDKVPSWDGEIRLYSSQENFQKDTILERIPVQVKGTWVKRFSKTRATFQADTSDLRNYLNDGGVMFFLVQIKNFEEYKIYYTSLLPFDLRRLLDEAGEQKTKSIKLDIFPHKHRDGIMRILADYKTNKNKQATLLPSIRYMKDLETSQMDIERFEFLIPGTGLTTQEDIFEEMLSHPRYIYAKPKNVDVSFAVDKIYLEQIIEHRNNPVEVDGEVLYNHIDVVRLPNRKKSYMLGTDVTITINDNNFNVNYSFRGTLQEQIRETKLTLALLQKQPIFIGGMRFPIDFDLNFHGHTLDDAIDRLSMLLRIDKTLKKLHVKKDLNLGNLSGKDLQGLSHLVNGILEHQPVPFNINGGTGLGRLTIGNIAVLLITKKNPDGPGFLVNDFFAVNDLILTANGMSLEEGSKISPYVMLTADIFKKIDNVDLFEVVPSIRKFPYSNLYGGKIVLFVLELLRLFDTTKDFVILDTVIQLIDFLQDNDDSQNDMNNINRLQTEKRRRKLTKEEIKYLISLKHPGIPLQYQLAANILLESFQEAQMIYDMLPDAEREMFDSFPISTLWKR